MKRLPQLDGIRGIAILVVIFHNETGKYPVLSLDRVFTNGWMGVDLFFVLSGLLITGILLDTKESSGYFQNFYARRCLRIWPLYYVCLLLMFGIMPLLFPAQGKLVFERSSPWWAFPLYFQNFLLPQPEGALGLLGVTWSLAIEEQFYLVWPLIVRWCSTRQLSVMAISVLCLSPVLRFLVGPLGLDLYSNTFTRLDGLMAGALLAIVMRSVTFVPQRFVAPAWLVLCLAAPLAFLTEAMQARWIVFSMSAIASAALIYVALYSGQGWLQRILTNRFLVYTGTISYGLYLLHKLPFNVGTAMHLNRHPAVAGPLLLAGAYALAALSWTVFEKPILDLKRFFATSPSPVREGAGQVVGPAATDGRTT